MSSTRTPTTTVAVEATYVGRPAPLGPPELGVVSGIAKARVDSGATLALTHLNLEGDGQADLTVHGGPEKAVYVHPSEHLAGWAGDLGEPALAGGPHPVAAFGENVSSRGVTEDDVRIGDVWAWGTALLQVCQPRWPCQKLTLHRASSRVGSIMRATGRTGWYLRVLQPGTVPAAGPITVADVHPAGVTVGDAHRAMLDRHPEDRSLVRRVLGLGDVLAEQWREPLRERLDGI
jgi:MOSC domain-containing protein YiiM